MTSFVKSQSISSHIASEMSLYEEDKIFLVQDVFDEKAEEEYQKRRRELDMGQGIYLADIDVKLLEDGEDVELLFNVIEGDNNEWGANVDDILESVIQIDLKNMTHEPLSLYSDKQITDIDCIGETILLDIKSGKVFAMAFCNCISVYVSKGAYVGDSKVSAVKISEQVLGSKMEIIKQWLDEQNKAIIGIPRSNIDK